jgi:EmrB/QacA subfamily drug resistance transporter
MQYKWTALSVTTVGVLITGIDSRILIVGLPTIAQQLHASAAEAIWITQSYLLASTIGLLLIGRISDLFGRIKIYNLGFVVFTLGSALCSLSGSAAQLILFRVVQGIGAGMIAANSAAVITDASPKNELGTMLGINHTAIRLGNIAGFTISGVILSLVDWRGLFYINIPIGIFGTIWAYVRLREIAVKDPVKKIDWTGFALFSIGLTLILVGITFLSYGFSGIEAGLFLVLFGGILMVVFIRTESRSFFPLLDLRLFKIRLFAMGNLAQLLNSLSWYAVLLLMAFYLQIGLNYSPLQAGVGILPVELTYLVVALVCGKLSDKYGTRILTTLGLSTNTIGFIYISTFGATTQYWQVALSLVIIGIGNGMFTAPNISAVMGSVPQNRVGIASAFRQTMFNVGLTTSYGLAILFLTLGISYQSLSSLLQSASNLPGSSVLRSEFLDGFRIAVFLLMLIDAAAIIPSAMRGSKTKYEEPVAETES